MAMLWETVRIEVDSTFPNFFRAVWLEACYQRAAGRLTRADCWRELVRCADAQGVA